MPKNKDNIQCIVCGEKQPYTIIAERPKLCPHCSAKWWDKPKNEYELFILQQEFKTLQKKQLKDLESKGIPQPPYQKDDDSDAYREYEKYIVKLNTPEMKKVLGEMYLLLRVFAVKIIKKILKNKMFMKREVILEKASDAAYKIIDYYMSKPEFIIEASFSGYLIWPIKNVLYAGRREEEQLSLDYVSEFDENDSHQFLVHNLGDHTVIDENNPEAKLSQDYTILTSSILEIIKKVTSRVIDQFGISKAIYNLIFLENKFEQKSDKYIYNYLSELPEDVKENYENSLFVIFKYIKDHYN